METGNGAGTVYFVSDAHFGLGGSGEGERARLFAEFAEEVRRRAAALYIAGDFFDFWIEYGSAIRPDYFGVLHSLRTLVDAGVEVHYLAGNHDFALGPFMEEAVGIRVHRGCVDVEAQGRRIHVSHGDRIGKRGLRVVDWMLRNRFFQLLYRLIHPDAGVRIGRFFSAMLRKREGGRGVPAKVAEMYRRAAQARLRTGKSDLVIYAHTHKREHVRLDGGEYCNVGSWMDNYDYAVLRDGRIQLMKWGSSAS